MFQKQKREDVDDHKPQDVWHQHRKWGHSTTVAEFLGRVYGLEKHTNSAFDPTTLKIEIIISNYFFSSCFPEFHESTSRQSKASQTVRQREEVGPYMWPGTSIVVLIYMTSKTHHQCFISEIPCETGDVCCSSCLYCLCRRPPLVSKDLKVVSAILET